MAVVTFDGVWDYGGTSVANANSIRVEMIVVAPGVAPLIQIGFGTLSNAGNGRLVGYSPGGPSMNPGAVDISTSTLITTNGVDSPAMALAASTRPRPAYRRR